MKKHLLTISLLVFMCCSCAKVTDIPGTYLADYGFAKEKLIFSNDGKYQQEVTIKETGKVFVKHGEWEFDAKKREIVIDQKNFMFVADGFGKMQPNFENPPPGQVRLPVYGILGRLTLGGSPDVEHLEYRKILKS